MLDGVAESDVSIVAESDIGNTQVLAGCEGSASRLDGWARCDPVLLGLSPAIREEACEPGVVWYLGAATGWAARQLRV